MIELPPLCVLEFSLLLVLTSPLWSRQALAEAERVRTEAEEEAQRLRQVCTTQKGFVVWTCLTFFGRRRRKRRRG